MNYKAIRLLFVPDAEARVVRIIPEPALPQVQIVNQLALDAAPCGDWVARMKLDAQGGANGARLQFAGSYSRDCGERVRHFSVLSHQQVPARPVYAVVAGVGRHLHGRRARRRAAAGSEAHREPAIARALGNRPRHQQVQQQRDGAPFVPDPGHRRRRTAGDTRQGQPRDPALVVGKRRSAFRSW